MRYIFENGNTNKDQEKRRNNPELFLAAISAFRLLNVPPLAAIPPEKSLNPNFLANHLHNDSSSKVTLGDNS